MPLSTHLLPIFLPNTFWICSYWSLLNFFLSSSSYFMSFKWSSLIYLILFGNFFYFEKSLSSSWPTSSSASMYQNISSVKSISINLSLVSSTSLNSSKISLKVVFGLPHLVFLSSSVSSSRFSYTSRALSAMILGSRLYTSLSLFIWIRSLIP